jgi:hypothetical protein
MTVRSDCTFFRGTPDALLMSGPCCAPPFTALKTFCA